MNIAHTIRVDFEEVDIPRGGEADYRWAGEGMLLHLFKICDSHFKYFFCSASSSKLSGKGGCREIAPPTGVKSPAQAASEATLE